MAKSGNLSFAELEGLWIQAGGPKALAGLMAAIALAESSGDPLSTNPTDNNGTQTSWGLWQISTGTHAEPAPNWSDPLENAKLAVAKWHEQGLKAWGTYDSGAYKQYLPSNAIPPVNVTTEGGQGVAGVQPTGNPEGSWTSALGGVYSDVTNGLMSIPKEVIGTFADIDKLAGKAYAEAQLFFRPSTYVRIGAGLFGFIFLIVGLVMLTKEARTQ